MAAPRNVRISARAKKKLEASREWWLEHRDKAPSAFDEELEEALTFIRENALLGPKVATTKRRVIRRVLMPRVGLHLYYHAAPRGRTATILVAWKAKAEKPPTF